MFVLSFSTYLHKKFGKSRVFSRRHRKYGSKNRGIRKIEVLKIWGNLLRQTQGTKEKVRKIGEFE